VNDYAEANPDWDWTVTEQIQALLSRFNERTLKKLLAKAQEGMRQSLRAYFGKHC
jgi:hypothetical protein